MTSVVASVLLLKFSATIFYGMMVSVIVKALRNGIYHGSSVFRSLVHGFYFLLNFRRKKIVPLPKDPILFKSATVLAKEIREGKIRSEDVVRSYIQRIQEVEPYINAVVEERFAQAVEEAKAVDAQISSGGNLDELEKSKPLLGVPFSVKVLLGVKGMLCTAACTLFKDLKAHEDAESVAVMKNSGAICICTTNSPEFGLFFETFNHVHGQTSNPYDTTRTSGGSSGGEGALIGSAGSLIGLGNDLGGSVRFPAFNNCIFAHKPTAGAISNKGTFPVPFGRISEFLSVGPMCRYADDLVTSMKVLAPNMAAELGIGEPVNLRDIKICYLLKSEHGLAPTVDNEIKNSILQVLRYFEKNYEIQPKNIEIDGMKRAFDIWLHLCRNSAGDDFISRLVGTKVSVKPTLEFVKYLFGRSNFTTSGIFIFTLDKNPLLYKSSNVSKMEKRLADLDSVFSAILDERTVFLMPTFPTTAMYHHEWMWSAPGVGYTAIFNMLGYPATQCPLGLSSSGLPLGLQIVGGKGHDNLTLSVAIEIEKAFGGWVPPGLATTENSEVV